MGPGVGHGEGEAADRAASLPAPLPLVLDALENTADPGTGATVGRVKGYLGAATRDRATWTGERTQAALDDLVRAGAAERVPSNGLRRYAPTL